MPHSGFSSHHRLLKAYHTCNHKSSLYWVRDGPLFTVPENFVRTTMRRAVKQTVFGPPNGPIAVSDACFPTNHLVAGPVEAALPPFLEIYVDDEPADRV